DQGVVARQVGLLPGFLTRRPRRLEPDPGKDHQQQDDPRDSEAEQADSDRSRLTDASARAVASRLLPSSVERGNPAGSVRRALYGGSRAACESGPGTRMVIPAHSIGERIGEVGHWPGVPTLLVRF